MTFTLDPDLLSLDRLDPGRSGDGFFCKTSPGVDRGVRTQ